MLEPEQTTLIERYCPGCGYDQIGAIPGDADALIRCSECGCEWLRRELLPVPPPGTIARIVLAVVGAGRRFTAIAALIGAILFFIGIMLPSLGRARCCGCRITQPLAAMQRIQAALSMYSEDHGGAYPQHAAVLFHDYYLDVDALVDRRSAVVANGNTMLGRYDLEKYDWSPVAVAALNEAINATDLSSSYYQLGDFWIARLALPTNDASMISIWTQPDTKGRRWVGFEDGRVEELGSREWLDARRADLQARARLSLAPLNAPP